MKAFVKNAFMWAWIDNFLGGSQWGTKGIKRIIASVIDGNDEDLAQRAAGLINELLSEV